MAEIIWVDERRKERVGAADVLKDLLISTA